MKTLLTKMILKKGQTISSCVFLFLILLAGIVNPFPVRAEKPADQFIDAELSYDGSNIRAVPNINTDCPYLFSPHESLSTPTAQLVPFPATSADISQVFSASAISGRYIFGGSISSGNSVSYSNKLMNYRIVGNDWQWQDITPDPIPENWPTGRASAWMLYSGGYLYLYGGMNETGWLDDCWVYDDTFDKWTLLELEEGSPRPSPRTGWVNGSGYLIGGTDGNQVFSDGYILKSGSSFNKYQFIKLTDKMNNAPPRTGATLIKSMMFGGYDGTSITDEFWMWDYAAGTWSQMRKNSINDLWPSSRRDYVAWIDLNGDLNIYGGFDGTNYLNDSWKYTNNSEPENSRWIKTSPQNLNASGTENWPAAGSSVLQNNLVLTLKNGDVERWKFNLLEADPVPLSFVTTKNTVYKFKLPHRPGLTNNEIGRISYVSASQGRVHISEDKISYLTYIPKTDFIGDDFITVQLSSKSCNGTNNNYIIGVKVREGGNGVPTFAPVTANRVYTKGIAPSPRDRANTWVDSNGDFWLYGGYASLKNPINQTVNKQLVNDLWKLTIASESENPRWIDMTPTGLNPEPYLYNFNAAVKGSDGTFWLYTYDPEAPYIWNYSPVLGEWKKVFYGNSQEAPKGSSIIYYWQDSVGDLWIYDSYSQALKMLPIESNRTDLKWKTINTEASFPPKVLATSFTDKLGNFWAFGGLSQDSVNSLWKFSSGSGSANPNWEKIELVGEMPSYRYDNAYATKSQKDLYIYGGLNPSSVQEMWRLKFSNSTDNPTWENLTPTNFKASKNSTWPDGSSRAQSWFSSDDIYYLFSGFSSNLPNHTDAFWKFDSASASYQFETTAKTSVDVIPAVIDHHNVADLKIVSPPQHGTLSPIMDSNRTIGYTYLPDSHWIGTDDFVLGFTNATSVGETKGVSVRVLSENNSDVGEWVRY